MSDQTCTCDIRVGGCTCGAMERERAFRQAVADAPEKMAEAFIAASGKVGEAMGRKRNVTHGAMDQAGGYVADYEYNRDEVLSLDGDHAPQEPRTPGVCGCCRSNILERDGGRLFCRAREQWLCERCYNAGEALERSGQPLHTLGTPPEPVQLVTKQQAAEMYDSLAARLQAVEEKLAEESKSAQQTHFHAKYVYAFHAKYVYAYEVNGHAAVFGADSLPELFTLMKAKGVNFEPMQNGTPQQRAALAALIARD